MKSENNCETLGIALILVKNPKSGKYLAVNERDGSWWLPGGRVDAPELFSKGAVRQTLQEGGIDIAVKGVLRFQLSPSKKFIRNKIIFYAEPINPDQKPKDFKDHQSLGATYLSLEEIIAKKPEWRGPELYNWAKYIDKGGKVFPLQLLSESSV